MHGFQKRDWAAKHDLQVAPRPWLRGPAVGNDLLHADDARAKHTKEVGEVCNISIFFRDPPLTTSLERRIPTSLQELRDLKTIVDELLVTQPVSVILVFVCVYLFLQVCATDHRFATTAGRFSILPPHRSPAMAFVLLLCSR